MGKIGLKGSVKVAVLIKSLGMDASAGILNYFTDSERKTIMKLASELGDVSPALVDNIAAEFAGLLGIEAGPAEEGLVAGGIQSPGMVQQGQAAQPGMVVHQQGAGGQPGMMVLQQGQGGQQPGMTGLQQGQGMQPGMAVQQGGGAQPGMAGAGQEGEVGPDGQALSTQGGEAGEAGADHTSAALTAILSMSPEQIAQLIVDEHPQTTALIIVHLGKKVASEVLSLLPEEKRIDVSLRIAKLDKILPGMVGEINQVFEDLLGEITTAAVQETDGIDSLADILNRMDGVAGSMILEELEEIDPEIVELIRQKMFIFDDLVLVDDKGMQNVLRSVETKTLALALKAASDEVKAKIFKNISDRAGIILKEEIDSLGAVKMKEVADAQLQITKVIQEKESKGEVVISGRGGDEFIG